MQNALLSGLSGLLTNQRYLDVIGNNLANTNTTGFKTSRMSFVDIVSQTISGGSGPSAGRGGTNPLQIGRGTAVGSIDKNMVQGSLLNTGRNLDLAIQGEGFFVLRRGNQEFYTRTGTFDIDSERNLVDLRTGLKVVSLGGEDIKIDLNMVLPPEATDDIEVSGNLPAEVNGPLRQEIATDQPFEEHQPAILTANAGPYTGLVGGETLILTVDNGAAQSFTLPPPANPGTGMTAAEVANYLNGAGGLIDATAFDNGGTLELRSNDTGNGASVFVNGASTAAAAIFAPGSIGIAQTGSEAVATGATDLNDLSENNSDYVAGDQVLITGSRPDGTAISGTFVYGTGPTENGTTLQDMTNFINGLFNAPTGGAVATLAADGTISILADESGEAYVTLAINDPTGAGNTNVGMTNWSEHFFTTVVEGTPPDVETVVTTIYDSQGQSHPLTLEFERQDDGTWNMTPMVDSLEGTVVSNPIAGLGFDESGNLNVVPATTVQVQWNGLPGTQSIELDFGDGGELSGLTQYGLPKSALAVADGFEAGSLSGIGVSADGYVQFSFTNGQIQDGQRIALVTFTNSGGLKASGDGLWVNTANSGPPFLTGALEGPAGEIVSGALEGSNVDISEQFVHLIEAQRSFQANARMITTTDEVLAELVNLV